MSSADFEPDTWVSDGFRDGGGGGSGVGTLRLRATCDHEAVHAAAAVMLGWQPARAAIHSVDRGYCDTVRVAHWDSPRGWYEDLIFTIAPSILCGDRSGGDADKAVKLARKIAGHGLGGWAMATDRDVQRVYDRAIRAVHEIESTPKFRILRRAIRASLEEFGLLDEVDLGRLVLFVERRHGTDVYRAELP
ncbi:MAG TPA: hypothetical protein VNS09_16070 [Solirubrobacter sp.]|nr:hypothetical protein [Solirubrobacter sp.]